jgi:hypothetical protein
MLPGNALPSQADPENPIIVQTNNLTSSDDYINLVLRACQTLTEAKTIILGSNLCTKMRELKSDFDYKSLGFLKFSDFLKDISKNSNYITLKYTSDSGGDIEIFLNDEALKNLPRISTQVIDAEPSILCQEYVKYLEDKLKAKFLPIHMMEKICQTIEEVFEEAKEDKNNYGPQSTFNGISLQRLSLGVLQRFSSDEIDSSSISNSIFKIHLSLYYSRAFYIISNQYDNKNPSITSFSSTPPNLLSYLIQHYIFLIIKSRKFKADIEAFTLLFYGDVSAMHMSLVESHLNDTIDTYNL